jgi:hypothetical protein
LTWPLVRKIGFIPSSTLGTEGGGGKVLCGTQEEHESDTDALGAAFSLVPVCLRAL